jgi:hypothetical protein
LEYPSDWNALYPKKSFLPNMSHSNENSAHPTESQDQVEFSLELTNEKARFEISLSSQQMQRFIRAAGLIFSHLLAASLGSLNLNPDLIQHYFPQNPPAPAPFHQLTK